MKLLHPGYSMAWPQPNEQMKDLHHFLFLCLSNKSLKTEKENLQCCYRLASISDMLLAHTACYQNHVQGYLIPEVWPNIHILRYVPPSRMTTQATSADWMPQDSRP